MDKLKQKLREKVNAKIQESEQMEKAKQFALQGKSVSQTKIAVPNLKLRCVNHLVNTLKQRIQKSFSELERTDADSLRGSMEASEDLLKHLTNYIKQYVEPCFPPYYNIYQTIKETYIDCICNHFNEHHIPNMEKYMESDYIDTDNTIAEILLELYEFITIVKDDILNDPKNEKLELL